MNRILEHWGLQSLMEKVAGAARLLNWTFQGEEISGIQLIHAMETCNAMGYPVLEKDEMREYCIQQSAKKFSEMVKDVIIPEEDCNTKYPASLVQRADNEK